MQATPKLKRGFALLDAEKLKELSRKGGKRCHEMGTGHEFSPEEAARAGRLGGIATQKKANRKWKEESES